MKTKTYTPKNALAFDEIKKDTLVTLHVGCETHLLWIKRVYKGAREFNADFIGKENSNGAVAFNVDRHFTRPTTKELKYAMKKLTALKEKILKTVEPIQVQLVELSKLLALKELAAKDAVKKSH